MMPSANTIILLAAAGAGTYYVFGRPITEVKEKWVEPKHANMPWVTKFIKPDTPTFNTIITDWNTLEPLNTPKFRPRLLRQMEKNGGFPPGW